MSLGLFTAIGVGISAGLQRMPRTGRTVSLTPVVQAVLSDTGSPAAGAAAPDVTIVVFTDYQCPICKATDPALEALLTADPGVRVIYKDWPIFGEPSRAAARLALTAARRGAYLPLHRALMAAPGRLDPRGLERAARSAGFDWDRLTTAESAARHGLDAQLDRHDLQAFSLGLQGTPAYLVGAQLIEGGLDASHLAQAVRRARRAGPPV